VGEADEINLEDNCNEHLVNIEMADQWFLNFKEKAACSRAMVTTNEERV